MTDDKKDAIGREAFDVEGELGHLAAAPVPSGLRQRVLDRATGARRNAALTPGMRGLAVVCSALIVAALVIDPLTGRHEAARMMALLDVTSAAEPEERGSDSLWAELGVDPGDIDRAWRRGAAMFGSKGSEASLKDYLQMRDWLKGMIDHENAEALN